MWTHRHPYRNFELTLEYIQERGSLALSRALNIQRVIGFIGSGITAAYGRPSWKALVDAAVEAAMKGLQQGEATSGTESGTVHSTKVADLPELENDPAARALYHALQRFIRQDSPTPDDLIVTLAVAEDLARHRGREEELRQAISRELVKERACARKHTRKALEWPVGAGAAALRARAEPLKTMLHDLKVSRFLTLNYDVEIERELERSFRTSGAREFRSGRHDDSRLWSTDGDYKSDFERSAGGSDSRAMDKIEVLNKNAEPENAVSRGDLNRLFGRRKGEDTIEFENGLGKSVQSVTLGADNVGDLVNFSLYSREYGAQVFHLHGRYDQPSHMVLTEKDYQNTYLRSGDGRETFEEALSAVFDGNDVLFVGVGMNEADIMRPLRQFVSQDRSPDFAKRHVYTLMERQCRLCKRALEGSFDDFVTKHFTQSELNYPKINEKTKETALDIDLRADTAQSLKLNTQFGIYTLYFGNETVAGFPYPVLRFLRLCCQVLKEVATAGDGDGPNEELFCGLAEELATLRAADEGRRANDCHPLTRKLLHQEEIDQFTTALKMVKLGWSRKEKEKAQTFAAALESELRSRALDRALYSLALKRQGWWEDWRLLPAERSARFGKAYIEADRKIPNMARHRPAYEEWLIPPDGGRYPTDADLDSIAPLKLLRAEAREAAGSANAWSPPLKKVWSPPINKQLFEFIRPQIRSRFARRIVRVTMPRGAGKGSLLHLLRQKITSDGKTPNRLVLDALFETPSEKTFQSQPFRYHGSFLLHISFSMEFASVIDALRRFFEDAIGGLLTDYPTDGPPALEALLKGGDPNSPDGEVVPEHMLLLHAIHKAYIDNQKINSAIRDFRKRTDASEPFRRGHRLEQLRSTIDAFQMLSELMDANLRVCVVMSGLDNLCNGRGEAYNPMYRAFFRLLTGEGCKRENESNGKVPMDLVLISGTPDVPIRYLSQEKPRDDVLRELAKKGLDYSPASDWYPYADGKRMLKKWRQLPPVPIDKRYWLQAGKSGQAFVQALSEPERPHRVVDPNPAEGNGTSPVSIRENKTTEVPPIGTWATIRTFCAHNVALSSWCAGAFAAEYKHKNITEHKDLLQQARLFLNRLNDAADRSGHNGVISEILETHRRCWWGEGLPDAVDDCTDARGSSNASIREYEGKDTDNNERVWPKKPGEKANLAFVILAHLSVFPMPVEPRVLYGCDEIHAALHRIKDLKKDGAPGVETSVKRGDRRKRCLELLDEILEALQKAHLVIKVQPKPRNNDKEFPEGWEKVHSRFTIQHQLRDYIGHQMDLFVPDRGERNFFQLSLYCDQPKDLPTPTQAHYRMIKELVERQIIQCRNTLWCLYQWNRARSEGRAPLSDEDRDLAVKGLTRRLLPDGAKSDSKEMDATLASIYALPQRIRALYGLMRTGFSIGAVSRLSGLPEERNPDEPFVRFRGWLRGITNAAIAMNYLQSELNAITASEHRHRQDPPGDLRLEGLSSRGEETPTFSRPEMFSAHHIAQPLYRDEIGWLLNERGLIAFVQGQLFDAIPLFERAAQVMRHRDDGVNSDPALNAAIRRVRLNHAIAMIERGNMFKAREMIESLLLPTFGSQHPGSQVSWIGEGYLGLIRHLAGDLANGKAQYLKLIERANEQEMPRLASIFNRHLADLYRSEKDFGPARAAAENAIGAALQSEQRDILWTCRLTQLRIDLAEGKFTAEDLGRTIDGALDYARSMGLQKIEIDALNAQAQVMLHQGERVLAGRTAAQAAALANRCGLRLMKISALGVYGMALVRRQQYHLAYKILTEAQRESERRGYQNRSGQLAALIEQIPAHATVPG